VSGFGEKGKGLAQDVYRDLRDRRLLPIVGLLLVAIVAVPFLIKGSDTGAATVVEQSTFTVPADAPEADPVVLAETPGLRDYLERLSGPKRNPFEQQLTGPAPGTTSEPTGGPGLVEDEAGGSTTTETEGVEPDTGGVGGPETVPVDDGVEPSPDPERMLITFTVDVKIGPAGDAKVLRDVESLTLLPSKSRPVVQYVQSEDDESAAVFVVSREIDGATGEGHCLPNRASCQFLRLEPGQEQELVYAPDGETYRVKLLAINRVEEKVESSSG
jgi:hypothetical protein